MKRSKTFVLLVVVIVVAVAMLAVRLRRDMRCAGFAGPEVTADELPPAPAAGAVRVAHFNVRNFPIDERPENPELGFSRRTNICDMQDVLGGLGADVMGFVEVCDTRRFPPILRRAGGERNMRLLFSQSGGRGGQHLAIAWNGDAFELVEGPVELVDLVVKPGLRPGLAVRLRSVTEPDLDFTVVEVHLDSGREDLEHRLRQLRLLAAWVNGWIDRTGDSDVILLGDFNTMGGGGIEPVEELGLVDVILADAGLERLVNATGCTQYWDGPGAPDGLFRASLLDHVFLRGLVASAPAESWLHCRRLGCGDLISRTGAEDGTFFDVSDHCPVTFEIDVD
jgi:endonuclease/exonuclease/phosphatase family metal-dependent hydrolase